MDNKEAMKTLIEIVDLTIETCKKDVLTKDGYGFLLRMLDRIPESSKKNFVLLCIKRGYPENTGYEVLRIIGKE